MRRLFAVTLIITAILVLEPANPSNLRGQSAGDEATRLMKLDREFDQATAEKGIEGWVAYFAENGSMLGATEAPITGPAAIR